jgi:hypothetical protein
MLLIQIVWKLYTLFVNIIAHQVKIVKGDNTNQGDMVELAANVTTFTKCNLDPSSTYTVTVTSLSGAVTGKGDNAGGLILYAPVIQ